MYLIQERYLVMRANSLTPFSLNSHSLFQEFKRLLVTGRLLEENTDVLHYQVDGITYLARTEQKAL